MKFEFNFCIFTSDEKNINMNNIKQSSAIYFKSLKLNNIRCFGESQTLDLSNDGVPSQWTLILGNNGVGKTTLLHSTWWGD